MSRSASIEGGEHSFTPPIVNKEPSKWKAFGFAVLIIVGMGGLVAAGIGLGGHLQAESLSQLGPTHSIIMMVAGGLTFLIALLVGSVTNRQKLFTSSACVSADGLVGTVDPLLPDRMLTEEGNKAKSEDIEPAGDHPSSSQECETSSPSWGWLVCNLNAEFSPGSVGAVSPHEHELSDLFRACKDPDVLFPSDLPWMEIDRDKERRVLLIKVLKDAFATGKKMVITYLNSRTHCVAAGFCVDGSFKIIDSMLDNCINLRELTITLNQANLRDSQGRPIRFHGKYINTHVQRGGHECMWFATLYGYHMGKQKKLEAFEEVNGAFLEGRLRCFEDYNNISGAQKIRSLKDKNHSYDSFMRSWAYRSVGLTVNRWEELSLQQIFNMVSFEERFSDMQGDMLWCSLSKSKYLPLLLDNGGCPIIIETSGQKNEMTLNHLNALAQSVPPEDMRAPVAKLLHNHNKYLLIVKKGSTVPYLYHLRPEQQLLVEKRWISAR